MIIIVLFFIFNYPVAPASLGAKRKTPVPHPPQLAFLMKETAGPTEEERTESTAGQFTL